MLVLFLIFLNFFEKLKKQGCFPHETAAAALSSFIQMICILCRSAEIDLEISRLDDPFCTEDLADHPGNE